MAFAKYDSEDTVFYCGPPHVGKEDDSPVSDIDRDGVVQALGELNGSWGVSYAELSDGLED